MKKNKIITLGLLSIMALSSLVGCSNNNVQPIENEVTTTEIDFSKSEKEILLQYNDKGLDILKAFFTNTESMKTALTNIGRVPNTLEFKSLNGSNLKLENGKISNLEGKNIVFEVVQANCSFCKETSPILEGAFEESDDTVVIPIFVKSTEDEIIAYYEEIGIEAPKYIINDTSLDIVNEFGLTVTPTTIFIDKSGKVSFIKEGEYEKEELYDIINVAYGDTPLYTMLID